jgi:hypothetical protein
MRARRGSLSIRMAAICSLGMAVTASGRVSAQYGYGFGYRYGYGYGSGSVGMSLEDEAIAKQQMVAESVSRYRLQTAQAVEAYQAANLMQQRAIATALENERRAVALRETYDVKENDSQAEQAAARRKFAANHLDEVIDPQGKVRWPDAAPVGGDLAARRQEADAAIQAAYQQYRAQGQASVQNVVEAKRTLYTYGQPALARLRSTTALRGRVSTLLPFLQGLDAALDALGEPASSPSAG